KAWGSPASPQVPAKNCLRQTRFRPLLSARTPRSLVWIRESLLERDSLLKREPDSPVSGFPRLRGFAPRAAQASVLAVSSAVQVRDLSPREPVNCFRCRATVAPPDS